jgi:hypothetical protein
MAVSSGWKETDGFEDCRRRQNLPVAVLVMVVTVIVVVVQMERN